MLTSESRVRWVFAIFFLPMLLVPNCNPNPDSAFINAVAASVTIQRPSIVSSSATCPTGQQLLGGSFLLLLNTVAEPPPLKPTLFQAGAVTEDYPSSDHTWTVTLDSSQVTDANDLAGAVLMAVAYCFSPAGLDLDVTTVPGHTMPDATAPPSVVVATASGGANCPVGSVLTGGGYRAQNAGSQGPFYNSYITAEGPSINQATHFTGWEVSLIYPNTQKQSPPGAAVFARCARAGLNPGAIVSQGASFGLPGAAATESVSCPVGTFTTGGGYSLPEPTDTPLGYSISSSFASTESQPNSTSSRFMRGYHYASGWRSDVYENNIGQMTESAYCIPFPKT